MVFGQEITLDEENVTEEDIVNVLDQLDSDEMTETDKYVMRELLSGKSEDLPFKSDLSMDQIKAIIRIRNMDTIMRAQTATDPKLQNKILASVGDNLTKELMQLMVSHKRQGRQEFILAWIGNQYEEMKDNIRQWVGQ
jgi:hypothetical protein